MKPLRTLSTFIPPFTTRTSPKYNTLPSQASLDTDDTEKTLLNHAFNDVSLIDPGSNPSGAIPPKDPRKWTKTLSFSACITLLNISLLIGSAFCYYQTWYRKPPYFSRYQYATSLNGELKEFTYYSPLLDLVPIPQLTTKISGSLFPGRNPSIFRLPPSPAVDAAWSSISNVTMFSISTSDVINLGKDPKKTVKLPTSLGFPPNRHLAQLDTVHQIHCLNALRKAVFAEYYENLEAAEGHEEVDVNAPGSRQRRRGAKREKKKKTRLHWIHLSHCTSLLLQNLLCNSTPDIITLNWVSTQSSPFPDFSINKKCRDFAPIQKWAEENALNEDLLKKITRDKEDEGFVELEAPIKNIMDAFVEAETPWDFDWGSL
ncbi:hypothetical protein ABW19_dt0203387 [Dactylella cylindrospora]|nr:hypothetical protein ABW19_dt0203387 [Dactylella cylindrospora]